MDIESAAANLQRSLNAYRGFDHLRVKKRGQSPLSSAVNPTTPGCTPDSAAKRSPAIFGEIVTTELGDEESLVPWLALESNSVKLEHWPIKRQHAGIDTDRLVEMLSKRTRLVVMSKASSAVGSIVELLPVALGVQGHESSLLVNWSAFLPHGAIDVRFLRSDFLIASTRFFLARTSASYGAAGSACGRCVQTLPSFWTARASSRKHSPALARRSATSKSSVSSRNKCSCSRPKTMAGAAHAARYAGDPTL